MKTNAARLLDRLKIAYELREYEVDDEHLDATTVAHKVGLDPATRACPANCALPWG